MWWLRTGGEKPRDADTLDLGWTHRRLFHLSAMSVWSRGHVLFYVVAYKERTSLALFVISNVGRSQGHVLLQVAACKDRTSLALFGGAAMLVTDYGQ